MQACLQLLRRFSGYAVVALACGLITPKIHHEKQKSVDRVSEHDEIRWTGAFHDAGRNAGIERDETASVSGGQQPTHQMLS